MTMGEQYRDYIYVEDLVEAIIILLSKKNLKLGEIINITYGKSFKLKEIAVKLANFIYDNGESILKIGNIDYRDTEVMNYHTSNKKVKDLLGWYPKTNLTIGLKKFSSLLTLMQKKYITILTVSFLRDVKTCLSTFLPPKS